MRALLVGGAFALLGLGAACGGAPSPGAASPDTREVANGKEAGQGPADQREAAAAIHAHKCVRCHAPPEKMRHTRAELEVIFGRHKGRIKLTPEEWQGMVEFLARPDEGTAFR
jgi:hypothetical protein